jgi:hypothetical protein
MIQQLIEIRNNILSALEQNDNILAKMAVNDLDTLLYKISQEEKEEPKQETLEEAAERLQKDKYGIFISKDADVKGQFVIDTAKAAFLSKMIEGAKWQQERMYSEKEVKELFNRYNEFIAHHDIEEWQTWINNQFKKQ